MKTSKFTRTLLTAFLLAGTGTLLQAQNSAGTCPLGNEPAYRGGGSGQGRRAGQGMGQRQRLRVCDGTGPQCAGTATASPAGKGPGGRQGGKLRASNSSRLRGGR